MYMACGWQSVTMAVQFLVVCTVPAQLIHSLHKIHIHIATLLVSMKMVEMMCLLLYWSCQVIHLALLINSTHLCNSNSNLGTSVTRSHSCYDYVIMESFKISRDMTRKKLTWECKCSCIHLKFANIIYHKLVGISEQIKPLL